MAVLQYDLLVVGTGPAGAAAAWVAAREGISVLLIDSRMHTPNPAQCAEFVPVAVRRYAPLAAGAVVQRIDTMLTYIDQQLVSTLRGPGYMLDRSIFDHSLVERAQKAGASFWSGCRALYRTEAGVVVQTVEQVRSSIKCKVIIGADGPRSTVGRWMNSSNQDFMVALQYRLPLLRPQTSTDIYFKPQYQGGYAWVFPKGGYANVGVGVALNRQHHLYDLTQEFVKDLITAGKLKDNLPQAKTAGLIPIGGPLPVTAKDNMMLAGDAAGLTHAVSGGGIMNALLSGEMAGENAARAVKQNDLGSLADYECQWKSCLGSYLQRAVRQRQDMERNWTYQSEAFQSLIKRTWIGFDASQQGEEEICCK